jgi:hypothetical protein
MSEVTDRRGNVWETDERGIPVRIVKRAEAPHASEVQATIGSQRIEVPLPVHPGMGGIFYNAGKQAIELPANAAIGAINAIGTSGNTVMDTVNNLFNNPAPIDANNALRESLTGLAKQKQQEYSPKGLYEKPLTPLFDAAMFFDMLPASAIGKLGSKIGAFKNAGTETNAIRNFIGHRYSKPLLESDFAIPGLGVNSTTDIDALNVFQKAGVRPTLGQGVGDARALDIETYSDKLPRILQEQNQGLLDYARKEFLGSTGLKGDLNTDADLLASQLRGKIIKEGRAQQAVLQAEVRNLSKITALKPSQLEAGTFVGPNGKQVNVQRVLNKLDLALGARYQSWKEAKREFETLTGNETAKGFLNSRDPIAQVLKKRPLQPLVKTLDGPSYTAAFNQAMTDNKSFADFLRIPGVEPEDALKSLNHKMLTESFDIKNQILNSSKVSKFLNENGLKYASAGADTKLKTSLQSFAHALKNQARHTNPETVALKLASEGDGGLVMTVASLSPLAFGGNVLAGRAAMGTAKLGLKIGEEGISKLMLEPDMNFLLARLSGTKYTNPASFSAMRKLIQVIGRLNIPAQFVGPDGEEIPIGSLPQP